MTKVILYEVDRLACVEKMRRHRVTHRVYVPAVAGVNCDLLNDRHAIGSLAGISELNGAPATVKRI